MCGKKNQTNRLSVAFDKLCGVIAHTQNSDCAHGKVSVLLGAASWNEVAKVLAAVCSELTTLLPLKKLLLIQEPYLPPLAVNCHLSVHRGGNKTKTVYY